MMYPGQGHDTAYRQGDAVTFPELNLVEILDSNDPIVSPERIYELMREEGIDCAVHTVMNSVAEPLVSPESNTPLSDTQVDILPGNNPLVHLTRAHRSRRCIPAPTHFILPQRCLEKNFQASDFGTCGVNSTDTLESAQVHRGPGPCPRGSSHTPVEPFRTCNRSARQTNPEDWEKLKETIKAVYLTDNHPVQDVMEYMAKRHDFHAS